MARRKYLRIMGQDFVVELRPPSDMPDCLARYETSNNHIYLRSDLAPTKMASALWHELVEAANDHGELALDHQKITALETMLFAMLRDNGVDIMHLTKGLG